MKKAIVPLIAFLTLCQAQAQVSLPRLVVWLTVEDLRSDYLETLLPEMRKDGLAKLVKEGVYYPQLKSPLTESNVLSAMAMLQTGHTPADNHITHRYPTVVVGNGRERNRSVFYDDKYIGYATNDKLSPLALNVSTFGDKLKESWGGKSLVYAVGIQAEEALVMGGRRADAAYWLDNNSGKWASTTYYKQSTHTVQNAVDQYNNGASSLNSRLSGLKWELLYNAYPTTYRHLPVKGKNGEVRLSSGFGSDADAIQRFKETPMVNDEVAMFTNVILKSSEIGADEVPDLLNIHLSVAHDYEENPVLATQDAYFRLDKAIADIIRSVEYKLGYHKEQVVYMLSGTGMARDRESRRQPVGTFFTDRCKTLLNLYLNPKYGRADWVLDVSERGEVYLNLEAAKKYNVSVAELEENAADFLREFSGVHDVVTSVQIKNGELSPRQSHLYHRSIWKNRPQLLYTLQQGWICGTENNRQSNTWDHERVITVASPLIFVWRDIQSPTLIGESTSTLSVSSVLAYALRIRPPNAEPDIPQHIPLLLHKNRKE
ncbi:MAG: alkaline phosphatase family protein [Porphyromonas sp.]|nr:alkaline phosphatase family protein [Porphyromonas sp.]